jgi:hypothetical protein
MEVNVYRERQIKPFSRALILAFFLLGIKFLMPKNLRASLKTSLTLLFWRRERVEVKKTKVFRDDL